MGDRAIIDYAQEIKESPSRIDAAAVLALGAESAYGGRILVIETGEVGGPRIIADIEGADPPPLSP